MENTLKGPVGDALKHYVYALVDPRDNKIFYIGKGLGDRVFQHAIGALKDEDCISIKNEKIREIINEGKSVKYYILRHGMDTASEAYLVESVLIDFLTFKDFNLDSLLTNIVAGHHQWDRGIKSIEEIKAIYDVEQIEIQGDDEIMLVSLNRSYRDAKKKGNGLSLYDITRGDWKIGNKRNKKSITYVLGVYENVVRLVIEPNDWFETDSSGRWKCEGEIVYDSVYLNKKVSEYPFGFLGAVRYINKYTKKKHK